MSPKRLTPDAWQRHITSWQQSGLSQKAYCQRHQLGLSTFHSKYRELKSDMAIPSAKPLTVLPVIRPVPSAHTQQSAVITIQSPQGWRLECPLTIPAVTLTTLLSALP
jgi:hypothetical protein